MVVPTIHPSVVNMVQDGSASQADLAAAVLDCLVGLRKATEDPTGRSPGLKTYPGMSHCTELSEAAVISQDSARSTSRSVLRYISVTGCRDNYWRFTQLKRVKRS